MVEYEETRASTLIRTEGLKDLPAQGTVLDRARHRTGPDERADGCQRGLRATIDVSYQSEPLLGCLVPIEMRERYEGREGADR